MDEHLRFKLKFWEPLTGPVDTVLVNGRRAPGLLVYTRTQKYVHEIWSYTYIYIYTNKRSHTHARYCAATPHARTSTTHARARVQEGAYGVRARSMEEAFPIFFLFVRRTVCDKSRFINVNLRDRKTLECIL